MKRTLKFNCFCGQHLEINEDSQGQSIVCPSCGGELTVPRIVVSLDQPINVHLNDQSSAIGWGIFKGFFGFFIILPVCVIIFVTIISLVVSSCNSHMRTREMKHRQEIAEIQWKITESQRKLTEIRISQEKSEARQKDIKSTKEQIKNLTDDLVLAGKSVEDAKINYDTVKSNYDRFVIIQPLLTNAVYVKIKKDLAFRTGIIPSQQQTISYLQDEVNKPYNPQVWIGDNGYVYGNGNGHLAGASMAEQAEYKRTEGIHLANIKNDLANTYAQISADEQSLVDIQHDVKDFQFSLIKDAQLKLNVAKDKYNSIQIQLNGKLSHLRIIENN